MHRTLVRTCLLAGVTFLAIGAWSGSARAGAAPAESTANVVLEAATGGPEPPVVQDEDNATSSGSSIRLPAEPPTATPPLDGEIVAPRGPGVQSNMTGKAPGGMSLLGWNLPRPFPTPPEPVTPVPWGALWFRMLS
ncbi:MAG TPA: hypothetical protein VJ400_05110 [Thermoplasmata archaeon]|nr:hypothetical protein [Thermoplasmata archaeon]